MRTLTIVIGLLMLVAGVIWALQGLGYLGGSPMTGVKFWALAGPFVAGLGLALALVGWRKPRK